MGVLLVELGSELHHLQCLLAVVGEIESATEVFIRLRQSEVDCRDIDSGAVVEPHSVPPFLWQ